MYKRQGLVDAQLLYVPDVSIPGKGSHNVLFVASEHDTVYGVDADSGSVLWQVTALAANETPSDNRGCGQVTPDIGITSTPVIDLSAGPHGTIYLVAMSKDASSNSVSYTHLSSGWNRPCWRCYRLHHPVPTFS